MNIKRHNVISAQFLIVLTCFIEQVSPKICARDTPQYGYMTKDALRAQRDSQIANPSSSYRRRPKNKDRTIRAVESQSTSHQGHAAHPRSTLDSIQALSATSRSLFVNQSHSRNLRPSSSYKSCPILLFSGGRVRDVVPTRCLRRGNERRVPMEPDELL